MSKKESELLEEILVELKKLNKSSPTPKERVFLAALSGAIAKRGPMIDGQPNFPLVELAKSIADQAR